MPSTGRPDGLSFLVNAFVVAILLGGTAAAVVSRGWIAPTASNADPEVESFTPEGSYFPTARGVQADVDKRPADCAGVRGARLGCPDSELEPKGSVDSIGEAMSDAPTCALAPELSRPECRISHAPPSCTKSSDRARSESPCKEESAPQRKQWCAGDDDDEEGDDCRHRDRSERKGEDSRRRHHGDHDDDDEDDDDDDDDDDDGRYDERKSRKRDRGDD